MIEASQHDVPESEFLDLLNNKPSPASRRPSSARRTAELLRQHGLAMAMSPVHRIQHLASNIKDAVIVEGLLRRNFPATVTLPSILGQPAVRIDVQRTDDQIAITFARKNTQ